MPHSYVTNLMHYTFSTKERLPFIKPELEERLRPYLGGIARENRFAEFSRPFHGLAIFFTFWSQR